MTPAEKPRVKERVRGLRRFERRARALPIPVLRPAKRAKRKASIRLFTNFLSGAPERPILTSESRRAAFNDSIFARNTTDTKEKRIIFCG